MAGHYQTFCPRCGGRNIRPSNDSLFRTGRELQQYYCEDCGYLGSVVVAKDGKINPEMGKDLKKVGK